MPKIISNTVVSDSANEWYGTLTTSGIQYEDGSRVTVQNLLGVKFKAPPSASITLTALLNPWQQVTYSISSDNVDTQSDQITAQVQIAGPYTFNTSDTLTWEVTGNLTSNKDLWVDSFELYADELPSGTLELEVADAPDATLSDSTQTIKLGQGSVTTPLSAPPGQTSIFQVATGSYTIAASELTNSDETVVATPSISPASVNLAAGDTAKVVVSYSSVQKFSALDIEVGQLSAPLDREQLHILVDTGNGDPTAFDTPSNHTTKLRRLPFSGTATVKAEISVNNVKYVSSQILTLANNLSTISIGSSSFSETDVDSSDFVELAIGVTTDLEPSNDAIYLRLVSSDRPSFIYSKDVVIQSGAITLGVPVAPGTYKVEAAGFIKDGTVYATQVASENTVASDSSSKLDLAIQRGANLIVRGFPDYLSFGAISNLADLEGKDLTAAKVTSVFKYAGNDGAGDSGGYLADDPATTKTVQLAALVSKNLGGQTVLPVMISYTVNLSLGDSDKLLQSSDGLAHSFGNLILSLKLAKNASSNTISAGFIVNPDFLGDNQQAGRAPSYAMPVIEPLTAALAHHNIDAVVPSTLTNTLKGYVQAVNWLIRTVAPEATFGWQVNLWGVGSSAWIYNKNDPDGPINAARSTANYARVVTHSKSLGVYTGDFAPDFLAIDRYEADDFTQRSYANSYCYGPYEWGRFYEFVKAVSLELQVPVMPWQIPASRIPSADETVGELETDHWGTGGTYIFGDPKIGSDTANIHPKVLDIKPATLVAQESVKTLFNSARPFDLTYPVYPDFPLKGIFTVLLGGGSTTGVISGIGTTGKWTQEKISRYMQSPIPLKNTSQKRGA